MGHRWQAYAKYILECIEKIYQIMKRGDILEDFVLYDAVLRNLETLADSTKFLPEDKKTQYTEIDWRAISGFRNVVAHDYLGDVEPEAIIEVIEDYLPDLKIAVGKMLEEDDEQNNV